jgi:hypothetical protein
MVATTVCPRMKSGLGHPNQRKQNPHHRRRESVEVWNVSYLTMTATPTCLKLVGPKTLRIIAPQMVDSTDSIFTSFAARNHIGFWALSLLEDRGFRINNLQLSKDQSFWASWSDTAAAFASP